MLVLVRDEASAAACIARARGLLAQVARAEGARQEQPDQYRLDGLYTERELGWIPHILEFVESRKRVLPFYVALHLRDKLRLSRKEMEAVQDLVWRMARGCGFACWWARWWSVCRWRVRRRDRFRRAALAERRIGR
jgi:hypothetical protein